ncbi:MAG: hypothetical protein ACO1SX_11885 [Actinomycetota bacterium]
MIIRLPRLLLGGMRLLLVDCAGDFEKPETADCCFDAAPGGRVTMRRATLAK